MAEEKVPDLVEVMWKGKSYVMIEKDYEEIKKAAFDQFRPYVDHLNKAFAVNRKIHDSYIDVAELRDGYFKAVCHIVIKTRAWVKVPDKALQSKAATALANLNRAMGGKKLNDLPPALTAAEAAMNAYRSEVETFMADFTGGAKQAGDELVVAMGVGFTVLGILAAPTVAVVTGMTAAQAVVVSAASAKVLHSAVEEVGKVASGQNVTVFEAVSKVAIDGAVAVATGGIASKFDLKLLGPLAKELVKKFSGKMSYCSALQLEDAILKYLQSTKGQAVMVNAATAAAEQVGDIAKKGKMPDESDVSAVLEKTLIATLTGGLISSLEGAETKLITESLALFESKLVPDAIKKVVAGAAPSSADSKKIAQDVHKALKEEIGKAGIGAAIGAMKGDESAAAIADAGVKALDRDVAFKRLIDAEVKAQLKKRKIPVK